MLFDSRQLFPATLQAARLARGMSLTMLADASGISAPTLSRIENGTRPATEKEIDALAGAISIPAAAICRPLVSERLGLSAFYHRKFNRAGSRAVNKIEHQCLLDVVALRELIGLVGLTSPESLLTVHLDELNGGKVEEAANRVRLAWRVPRGPIRDLCATVENAGCLVIHSDFGLPEMDAIYQKVRGVPPLLWVNSRKPLDRVRMSIAHELGHLILHEEEPVDHALAERQADEFASAFLMPRADFRSECPSRLGVPELIELKRRWRCSMVAIIRRARDVGKIDEQHYTNLMISVSRQGWRKQEPYPITGESPRLLANAIHTALRELHLNDDELADRLAIPVEQLRSWMQPFPGQRVDPNDDTPRLRIATGY
jgi:Zn-dependent peptidase ImmA (M78 family)/transcriptional regulator with XRE-family HTH domain